jgi:drug/metabolite transporter (DMT)-like permease
VFRERLTRLQLVGSPRCSSVSAAFQRAHRRLWRPGVYARGVAFIVMAAVTGRVSSRGSAASAWSSAAVMAWVNLGCGFLLAPLSAPDTLFALSPARTGLLAVSVLNTLVAYGTFAEALVHWEASKVGATLSATPVLTFALAPLVATAFPGSMPPEDHNALAYLGAGLVVAGSALVALAGGPSRLPLAPGGE